MKFFTIEEKMLINGFLKYKPNKEEFIENTSDIEYENELLKELTEKLIKKIISMNNKEYQELLDNIPLDTEMLD